MANLDLLRLERARRGDAPPISRLSNAVIETGLRPSWSPQRVLHRIRDAESMVLVARDERERIAGFAIMRYGDDSAHLDLLGVAPAWQRQGLGRRLVEWLERSAIVAGTFQVTLEVRADNSGGFEFYRTLGYAEVSRIRGYYRGLIDAISLRRDLSHLSTGR
jgi:ribosomal protein S18 acetylase RimI-like enzyme